MFGKTLSLANLCTVLAMCSVLGMTTAMPVRRENAALFERDLQPIQPGAQIQQPSIAGMVDLLDQYKNLAEQVAGATKGTPQYDVLVAKMNSTKAALDTKIKGIAVLVDSSPSIPTTTSTTVNATVSATVVTATTDASKTTSASSVSTAVASSTASASSSIISPAPTNKITQSGGPITIVTQVGTSIIVIASQGTTSTVTLATLTSISASPQSTLAAGSAPGAASASSTFDINTMPAPDRKSGPQPTGTAASASAAQSQAHNGAMSLDSSTWSESMWVAGLVVATLIAM